MMEKGAGRRWRGLLAALPSLLWGSAQGAPPSSLRVFPPGAQILFLEQSGGSPWGVRQESWSNPAECHPQRAGPWRRPGHQGCASQVYWYSLTPGTLSPYSLPVLSLPVLSLLVFSPHTLSLYSLPVLSLLVLSLCPVSPYSVSSCSLPVLSAVAAEPVPGGGPACSRASWVDKENGAKCWAVGPWVWPLLPHLLHLNSGLWPCCALPGTQLCLLSVFQVSTWISSQASLSPPIVKVPRLHSCMLRASLSQHRLH